MTIENATLDDAVAALFDLDGRVEIVENLAGYDSADCTNDGCTASCVCSGCA